MRTLARLALLLAVIVLHAPVTAWSQSATLPLLPSPGQTETTSESNGERNAGWNPSPMIPDTDHYPVPPVAAPAAPCRVFQDSKFDATFLPGGSDGLEITDLELSTTVNIPLAENWAPLRITPYAAARFWDGPTGAGVPDLPSNLYDLNVEFAWRPRLAEWLFADLAVTPGLYTDFKDVTDNSFQMRGRGIAIIAFSPQLQLAAGGMYVNRNKTKFLPAGGVIWNPSEDTRCFLVFPQPKVSHRFTTLGTTQLWGYVAGEFGGGRWEVERANGTNDSLDYTDLRVNLGVEAVFEPGLKGHLEVGYVFARRVNFTSDTPDYKPQDTVMLRAGFSF